MSTMTLEQVRDWHRHQLNFLPESGVPTDLHQNAAGAIDAHLAQSEQAVDVGAIREVIDALRNMGGTPNNIYNLAADKLTRALSGEKAGPVGDEADAQWANNVKIPAVARLYYTGIGSRRYKRASVQSGPGEPLCFVSTARELLRRQRAALLPAFPAPGKEG